MIKVYIYGSSSVKDMMIIEIFTEDHMKLSHFCQDVFYKIISQCKIGSYHRKVSNDESRITAEVNFSININEGNVNKIEELCTRFRNLGWTVIVL